MAGDKYYELSNHLGNVLAVVSDKKIPQFNTDDVPSSGLKVFNPEVLSYSDYDPFGSLVPNRHSSGKKEKSFKVSNSKGKLYKDAKAN